MLNRGGVGRLLRGTAKILGKGACGKTGRAQKVTSCDLVNPYRERKPFQPAESRCQFVDRIVRAGDRAVPSGVRGFKLKIRVDLFAGLQSGKDSLPSEPFKFAAVEIDAVFRADPVFMFLK